MRRYTRYIHTVDRAEACSCVKLPNCHLATSQYNFWSVGLSI